tara:strand:- start:360 stop:752 length:393 start_codon:yes stop_codon:yes gene_type:complete
MIKAILTREYRLHCTLGTLEFEGLKIETLERPWLNNKANKSCIPEGTYQCNWMESSGSGKYTRVWHVQNVADRTAILFHAGNFVTDSLGCILVGLSHGYLSGKEAVLSSRNALDKMREHIGENTFTLVVQ